MVLFSSWSLWNNRFTDPAILDAIIDAERKSFGSFIPVERQVINGKYLVTLATRIQYQDFLALINARKVELRLADVEFVLNDTTLKKLREFASFIHP